MVIGGSGGPRRWVVVRFALVLFMEFVDVVGEEFFSGGPTESTLMRWDGLLVALKMMCQNRKELRRHLSR